MLTFLFALLLVVQVQSNGCPNECSCTDGYAINGGVDIGSNGYCHQYCSAAQSGTRYCGSGVEYQSGDFIDCSQCDPNHSGCPANKFQCDNGDCIQLSYFCDGSSEHGNANWGADCSDGSDEVIATCCADLAPLPAYDGMCSAVADTCSAQDFPGFSTPELFACDIGQPCMATQNGMKWRTTVYCDNGWEAVDTYGDGISYISVQCAASPDGAYLDTLGSCAMCDWIPVGSAECPSRDDMRALPDCSANMDVNALCEADSPLPNAANNNKNHYNINNCGSYDIFKYSCTIVEANTKANSAQTAALSFSFWKISRTFEISTYGFALIGMFAILCRAYQAITRKTTFTPISDDSEI